MRPISAIAVPAVSFRTAATSSRPFDDLRHGERAGKPHILLDDAESTPDGGKPRIATSHTNRSLFGPDQADDVADERRLTGAIRPEQRYALAFSNREIHTAERNRVVVRVDEALCLENMCHVHHLLDTTMRNGRPCW